MLLFAPQVDTYNSELRAGSTDEVGTSKLGDDAAISLVDFDFHHLCRNMQYAVHPQQHLATSEVARADLFCCDVSIARCTQCTNYVGFTEYGRLDRRYQNLSLLVEQCEAHIQSHGYFEADGAQSQNQARAAPETLRRQSGCFRTNCKDALDRTNVVQSVFAERFLVERLRSFGLLGETDGIGTSTQLSAAFMHTWADNADALAMAYVGTPALKTDFTRTGKRTIRGVAMDGWHSFRRYFLGERPRPLLQSHRCPPWSTQNYRPARSLT